MTPLTAEVREVERVRRPECWGVVRVDSDGPEIGVMGRVGFNTEASAQLCADRWLAAGSVGIAIFRIPGEPEPELLKQLRGSVAMLGKETNPCGA